MKETLLPNALSQADVDGAVVDQMERDTTVLEQMAGKSAAVRSG